MAGLRKHIDGRKDYGDAGRGLVYLDHGRGARWGHPLVREGHPGGVPAPGQVLGLDDVIHEVDAVTPGPVGIAIAGPVDLLPPGGGEEHEGDKRPNINT